MQGPTGHPRSGQREMSASGEGSGRRPVFRAALDPLKKRWLKTLLYTVVAEVAVPEMSMGSAPPDLSLREERKANASRDQSGPILPWLDFEIQVGVIEKAVGRVNAVWKD